MRGELSSPREERDACHSNHGTLYSGKSGAGERETEAYTRIGCK